MEQTAADDVLMALKLTTLMMGDFGPVFFVETNLLISLARTASAALALLVRCALAKTICNTVFVFHALTPMLLDKQIYFNNIQNMKTTEAVRALSALSQDTRLDIFRLLVQQGTSGLAAGEIAEQLRVSPATLSFHLKELTHAKLIASRQDGRFIFYTANFGAMNRLLGFLSENCCAADGAACAPASAACAAPSLTTRPNQRKVKA